MDNKSTKKFEFPSIYNFPPFFTKQPNLQTWESQLSHWIRLILKYCEFYKIYAINLDGTPKDATSTNLNDDDDDVDDLEGYQAGSGSAGGGNGEDADEDELKIKNNSIFNNTKISRSLKTDMIREVLIELVKLNKGEWINDKDFKSGLYIYWKTPEEWSDIILEFIENTGQQNSILTIYELRKSELVKDKEFYNINEQILIKSLYILVKKGRAQILKDEENNSIAGVKIV
ncbi:hypothetical protein BVG19_g5218 [[Candida] boidinii]|nr:hypothetical protein BVG19_g5218 [[Candida] boidinii]OWB52703.1 hypothetical protein B5S27_g4284 [[Candida] boidinii]OWB67960.1 hypothetical protein B5S30_g3330 [[Candida] boidinii]OWB84508.1 hypothetical protein B5S33_g3155 [[Candida] boidinii]GMF98714.1 unnamed protein product [[Candida] boidinii]